MVRRSGEWTDWTALIERRCDGGLGARNDLSHNFHSFIPPSFLVVGRSTTERAQSHERLRIDCSVTAMRCAIDDGIDQDNGGEQHADDATDANVDGRRDGIELRGRMQQTLGEWLLSEHRSRVRRCN